jgi:hypothetical protein
MKPTTLITEEGRICTCCGEFKLWDGFYRSARSSTGYRAKCISCHPKTTELGKERRKLVVSDEGRECTICGKFKSWNEFPRNSRNKKYGRGNKCNPCNRAVVKAYRLRNPRWKKNASLSARYGLTVDEYETMLQKQKHACAICGGKENMIIPSTGRTYSLSVDHNHKTGKVRGLLCTQCNHMLGRAADDPEILRRAAKYLERG